MNINEIQEFDFTLKARVTSEILESSIVQIPLTLITFYVLFIQDILVIGVDKVCQIESIFWFLFPFIKDLDQDFSYFNFVCLLLFLTELIATSIFKVGYIFGFTFFLDLVSTASMIFDIPWLTIAIFGSDIMGDSGNMLRAGKASRVATRAARIVRFIRLIRLVRVGKLYQTAFEGINNQVHMLVAGDAMDPNQQTIGGQQNFTIAQINLYDDDSFQEKQLLQTHNQGRAEESKNKDFQNQFGSPQKLLIPGTDRINEDLKFSNTQKQPDLNENDSPYAQPFKGLDITKDRKEDIQISGEVGNPEQSQIYQEFDEKIKKHASVFANTIFKAKSTFKKITETLSKNDNSGASKDENSSPLKQSRTRSKFIDEITDTNHKTKIIKEGQLGKILSDLTTKRVMTLIFVLVIFVPFFNVDTWNDSDAISYSIGLNLIQKYNDQYPSQKANEKGVIKLMAEKYIQFHQDQTQTRMELLELKINQISINIVHATDSNTLRENQSKSYSAYDKQDSLSTYSIFSDKTNSILNAILSIVRTVFIVVLLTTSSIFFAKDTGELVINPIEDMMSQVRRIEENPLEAAIIEQNEAAIQEEIKHRENNLLERGGPKKKDEKMIFQTKILEKTIIKTGALLALGFGVAGSNIIAENMRQGGDINPMIPGQKVVAIFGFVSIRNFLDATIALQENVMVFVNEISEIVHSVANEMHGAANKNLGDCYLMVWRIKQSDNLFTLNEFDEIQCKNNKSASNFVDMPLISFLKILNSVQKLSETEKFVSYIDKIKMIEPEYKLKTGYGLHIGWAIQGAIGSEFKIDASYLSPNVNMASRLEYATKQYGVHILISGALYNVLSQDTKKEMRQVDRITVKGSNQPIDVFTCDVDLTNVSKNRLKRKLNQRLVNKKKLVQCVVSYQLKEHYEKVLNNKQDISSQFQTDLDLIEMRAPFPQEFTNAYHEALYLYLEGYWEQAQQIFELSNKFYNQHLLKLGIIKPGQERREGSVNTLVHFMQQYDFQAPSTWKGYRELTEK